MTFPIRISEAATVDLTEPLPLPALPATFDLHEPHDPSFAPLRASLRARRVVDTYRLADDGGADDSEAVRDLLTDLLHLADRFASDGDGYAWVLSALDLAQGSHADEVTEARAAA